MIKRSPLDLSVLPNEIKLLLWVIQGRKKQEMIKGINLEAIDWHGFVQLAVHHRVYPSLFERLQSDAGLPIPHDVQEQLASYYKNNTFKMLYLAAEMEAIARLLEREGVHTLFLKGPILAQVLYNDLSLRTSSDLDVLIPFRHLEKVEHLLCATGYVKHEYFQTVLNDWKWRHHHMTFYHTKKKIKLEIHWRLHPGPGKEPSFAELWEKKQELKLSKTGIAFLGNEDLFLFLILHGARHGWSRLRWLVDLQKLMEQPMDGVRLQKLLKRFRATHIGGQVGILTDALLKTTVPTSLKVLNTKRRSNKLAQEALFYIKEKVNLHQEPVPEAISRYHKKHLFKLMSHRQKILFLFSFLYPYSTDVQTLPLPRRFHFLYFLLRPFLLLWRKLTKQVLI
ncbi:hypothetical protein GCM10011391_06290 [Pullulanibacillus camelliae]|uniref:Renal dipeptidase n=1 Tax=Pullulanibacillus camelliae TaxID=1707096 RepID=A0A8J2YFM2_9BACL|nr:nucleotidyltransferase family protein [Pullulanibacillus camelliae]GGE30415.1 hypothetical protein GCM10011391_06290 [Pullulanibacillus camelliae]